MIEEDATVVEVEPDQIIVQTLRKSSCNSCAANKACGTAVLSKSIGQKHSIISISKSEADTPVLSPGDQVVIGINESMLFSGSMLAYMVPIIAMFIFALTASWLGTSLAVTGELHIILSALAGLASGLYFSHLYISKGRQHAAFAPVLLRKLQHVSAVRDNILLP